MTSACPLLFRQIDATIVRISSFFVLLMLMAYLATSSVELLYLLSIDFLIRIYGDRRYSLITRLSMTMQKVLRLDPKMEDAGAKRLAAQLGLLFVLVLIAAYHLHLDITTAIVATSFILCVSMELFLGYCVGCKLYVVMRRLIEGA